MLLVASWSDAVWADIPTEGQITFLIFFFFFGVVRTGSRVALLFYSILFYSKAFYSILFTVNLNWSSSTLLIIQSFIYSDASLLVSPVMDA